MGAPVGNKNSPGRRKGSTNRDVAPIREKFQQLLEGYTIEQMLKDLKSLEPNERMKIISSLAEYITPKLQRGDNTNKVEITEKQIFSFGGKEITF